jgi:hypothetical protein
VEVMSKAFLSVRQWRGGELDRGGWWWPRGAHERASAQCLHGAGLGSSRLDGPHAVLAREEEAEALREALSSGAWHRHHGGAAAMTVIVRRGDATPQSQCDLPAARRRGGRQGDAMGSSQRLGRSTLV